jgi:UDP-2-acetamido-2,6-beta-L-arabino-hexul-4-ose reductase
VIVKVLVTGSNGFVGKNLCAVLRRREDVELLVYDLDKSSGDLERRLEEADVVFHLS